MTVMELAKEDSQITGDRFVVVERRLEPRCERAVAVGRPMPARVRLAAGPQVGSCSRAKRTQSATSAVPAQRAINAGRLSTIPFHTLRAAS